MYLIFYFVTVKSRCRKYWGDAPSPSSQFRLIMTQKLYYSPTKSKSYNALFNFELGERGVGKTYGWLKSCVEDFIKKDHEFIYLRRREKELEKAFPSILKPHIANQEFEEHAISRTGLTYYLDGVKMGEGLALSTSSILKSTSFEKVHTIIFDEFLCGTGRQNYLKNEVVQFLDLYETIARMRDVRCVFLGNAVSASNPYFSYFHLSISPNREYQTFADGSILLHYIDNPVYREKKRNSKFGKLIAGSQYEKYAIDNKWLLDQSNFIGERPASAVYLFSITFNNHTIGIWRDNKTNYLFVSDKFDANAKRDYCLQTEYMTSDRPLIKKGNFLAKHLVVYFENGRLISETQELRNYMTELIGLLR